MPKLVRHGEGERQRSGGYGDLEMRRGLGNGGRKGDTVAWSK